MSIAENNNSDPEQGLLANLKKIIEASKLKRRLKKIAKRQKKVDQVSDQIALIEPQLKRHLFDALKKEVIEAFENHAQSVEKGVKSGEYQLELDIREMADKSILFCSQDDFNKWADVSFEDHISVSVADVVPRENALISESRITVLVRISPLLSNFNVFDKHIPVSDLFYRASMEALEDVGVRSAKKGPPVRVTTREQMTKSL